MRLATRIVLVLAGLLVLIVAGIPIATDRYLSGAWPYAPLTQRDRVLPLDNGGRLHVVEVENRDWLSEGNTVNVYYSPPGDTTRDGVPDAFGSADRVRAWSYKAFVIVVGPDARPWVLVRSAPRRWVQFNLTVPISDDLRAGRLEFNYSGLHIDELRAIAAPVESLPPAFQGSIRVDDFSPSTGELYLTFFGGPRQVNRVRLRLEPGGRSFRLADVHPLANRDSGPVSPYRASPQADP